MTARRPPRRLALALFAAGVLLPSCVKDSAEAKPEREAEEERERETRPSPGQRACEKRMDRLAARMKPLAKESASAAVAAPGITPIESSKGKPIRAYGPPVVVGKGGELSLNYQPVKSIQELEQQLAMELARMRRDNRQRPIFLWADARTRARRVARVAAAAPDELEVRLALAGPERERTDHEAELLKKPRIEKVHEEFQSGLEPADRAMLIAEKMEKAIGLCAPLIEVFGNVAGTRARARAQQIAEGAPKAIRKCRCEVGDLDMLEYLLRAALGAFDRPARWIPVSAAPSVLR